MKFVSLIKIAYLQSYKDFPGGSVVKTLPASAEVMGSIVDSEDPLGEEMATHSSILAWTIPQTEKPGWL